MCLLFLKKGSIFDLVNLSPKNVLQLLRKFENMDFHELITEILA